MTTEDIRVNSDGQWVELGVIDKEIIVYNDTNISYRIRLGSSSSSHGIELVPEGTVLAGESVFVRSDKVGQPISGSLRVTR